MMTDYFFRNDEAFEYRNKLFEARRDHMIDRVRVPEGTAGRFVGWIPIKAIKAQVFDEEYERTHGYVVINWENGPSRAKYARWDLQFNASAKTFDVEQQIERALSHKRVLPIEIDKETLREFKENLRWRENLIKALEDLQREKSSL